jgi:large subunit ribosomal protein L15
MSVRRRKKSRKLRGRTRSMGWGRIGQHRKTGSKGGRGAAGLLKHEWSWTIKYAPRWFGKHGFNPPPKISQKPTEINLYRLSEIVEELVARGKAVEEEGRIVINLDELGYTKLLGSGKIDRPVKILVRNATETAIKKVEEAGGTVISSAPQK